MNPIQFVNELSGIRVANAFNPYADRCRVFDHPDAPKRRSKVLLAIVEGASRTEVDSLWIGRDLGYRGGRRSGLALTDDVHVTAHGARWGVAAARVTKGQPVSERTAAVIWRTLDEIENAVFLWNVFPLHPHNPADPFSNRPHSAVERALGEEVLTQLIALVRPRRLIALGADAAGVARRLGKGQSAVRIRHPSYGGQTEFTRQINDLYPARKRQRLL